MFVPNEVGPMSSTGANAPLLPALAVLYATVPARTAALIKSCSLRLPSRSVDAIALLTNSFPNGGRFE